MGGIEKALCSWAILNLLPAVKSKGCTLRAVMRRATLNGPRTNTHRPPTQAALRLLSALQHRSDARVEVEIAFARGHDAQLAALGVGDCVRQPSLDEGAMRLHATRITEAGTDLRLKTAPANQWSRVTSTGRA